MRRTNLLPLAVAATVLLVACGSSKSTKSSSTTVPKAGISPAVTNGKAPVSAKPDVTVPDTPAPTALQIHDDTVGTGAVAESGKKVTVQYVGVAYSTKKQFDASWDRGTPFVFTLGVGQVIKGWDQGVVGMKEGGRRTITIPPALGYGAAGAVGVIKPNETLIFVVDLLKVG